MVFLPQMRSTSLVMSENPLSTYLQRLDLIFSKETYDMCDAAQNIQTCPDGGKQ
jgi:hypothetical protein